VKPSRWLFASPLAVLAAFGSIAACGSRTGLLVPSGGPEPIDGSEPDVADANESVDALPPIDVFVPPSPGPCPDSGATLIYLVTSQGSLLSFYPPTATFTTLGTLNCPTVPNDFPFSMAVDHAGVAYVAYDSGQIFRVSTKTLACENTGRVPSQDEFNSQFGMGFAGDLGPDAGDAGQALEQLYIAGDPGAQVGMPGTEPVVLGRMDTTTFAVTRIGQVAPSIYLSELSGTGAGQLFGFYQVTPSGISVGAAAIGQIDRTTGQLIAMNNLPGVSILNDWAFGFWGGSFYVFTAPDGADTVVQKFDPTDGTVSMVATTPGLTVVGAGVSTCAPQM
jgi:hypothetical protein